MKAQVSNTVHKYLAQVKGTLHVFAQWHTMTLMLLKMLALHPGVWLRDPLSHDTVKLG